MRVPTRPTLHRLLVLDRLIRSGCYPNASTAADELEVHPRTIHRDLDFLRDTWSAPLEFNHGRNGFFYRDPDYALPLQRVSEGELLALFLAERLLDQYRGTPYAASVASVFRKLTASLPEDVTINLNHLAESYSFRQPAAAPSDAARFAQLTRAVSKGQQLELVYWTASRDEVCRRVVDPYHLAAVSGDWFLVGYCHLREDVRMFVPSRIRSLRETGKQFQRPADFCIGDYLDATFRTMRGSGERQRVRLRFTAKVARYIREKVWHPSQKFLERKDGSLIVTLRVSHLLEVRRWAMSWGADCEVLEPGELRQEVRDELEQMREIYGR